MEKPYSDKNLIGKEYPIITYQVKKEMLIAFAKATEQVDPIYYNEKAAKENGHPTIIAPPTFLTCLLYTSPSPRDVEESRMPSSA